MRELAACTMNFSVISSMVLAQAIVQVVDFYLDDARTPERATLVEVCKGRDAKSLELLRGYSREGMRLSPQFHGLLRSVAQNDSIPQGEGFEPLFVNRGDTLYANLRDAHLNVGVFNTLLSASWTNGLCYSLMTSQTPQWSIQLDRSQVTCSGPDFIHIRYWI